MKFDWDDPAVGVSEGCRHGSNSCVGMKLYICSECRYELWCSLDRAEQVRFFQSLPENSIQEIVDEYLFIKRQRKDEGRYKQ